MDRKAGPRCGSLIAVLTLGASLACAVSAAGDEESSAREPREAQAQQKAPTPPVAVEKAKPEALRGELKKVEIEIRDMEQGEPTLDATKRLKRFRARAEELREGHRHAEELRSLKRRGADDDIVMRAFNLGAKLGDLERRISALERADASEARDARLAELRAKADSIRGERKRLRVRNRAMREKAAEVWPAVDRRLEIITIEHRDAVHVADVVADFLPPDLRIVADPGTNKLIVLAGKHGLAVTRRIVKELDVPVPREARVRHESDLPSTDRQRPTYDYERFLGADRNAGAMPDDRLERPHRSFQRTLGTLVEKGDASLTVLPQGYETPQVWQLPQIQVEEDEWRVDQSIAEEVGSLEQGDAVVLEWWEAEGVRYVEGLGRAPHEEVRVDEETYILGE